MKRLVFVLILLLATATVAAQGRYAAVLRVLNTGVEFRRINTEAWERARLNAEMPFGAGDTLRLNGEGRALITFAEGAELLLLPYSEVELLAFEQVDAALSLRLRLSGQAVIATSDAVEFSTFEARMAFATVTQPARHFALQSDAGATRVIVAVGTASLDVDGTAVSVRAGDGVRVTADSVEPAAALTPPMHFARLDSTLDACLGVAQATERDSVNIRQGPGNGYDIIGEVLNGESVEIVATTPQRDRYRIRFLSAFGWVVASGVVASCPELPIMPYDTLELVYGVIGITADDTRLLTPFFGARRDDYLFYPLPAGSP